MNIRLDFSPGIYIFIMFSLLILASLGTSLAKAGQTDGREIPLAFDLREHIPKPDLSGVERIRFLTTVDFPPFNFIDQSSKLSGFHVDLAREICRELAMTERCQIAALPFKELQPALERGDGEVVAAGVAITPQLRERFLFSSAFFHLPARFATHDPKATLESLSGQPTGVVSGTTHEAMLRIFFPKSTVQGFATKAEMLLALKAKKIVAVFGDGLQLTFWVHSPEAAKCCKIIGGAFYSREFLGEGLALMLKPEDQTLRTAMDHALLALARNGRLQEIFLRYFPDGL